MRRIPLAAPGLEHLSRASTDIDAVFDIDCTDCARLAEFLARVRKKHPDYHARPVPPFGASRAELLIVGLAPGLHGANRTGRPFTGDFAGILLFRTLHKFGFASHEGSADPGDGLRLHRCRVTNAVKCLPPENKPTPDEARRCNHFLASELAKFRPRAVLALGTIAHHAVLRACGLKPGAYRFAHHAVHVLGSMAPADPPVRSALPLRLFDSYHCSRYNTQTRRLTVPMFEAVVNDIATFLSAHP